MNLRLVAAALACAGAFQANALLLTPSTSGVIIGSAYGPDDCEPGCIEKVFSADDLTLLYKAEAETPIKEEGLFAPFYETEFLNSATDPSGATITNSLVAWIACAECYLAIKDGNHSPGYYFYDLSGWDGKETITLSNFWPYKGAISHVSIWGDHTSVPEPGTLSLLGAGLLLAALGSRRKRAR